MINGARAYGALRHVAIGRALGVLNHSGSAAALDREEPGGAVVERAREQHPDNPGGRSDGCRTEERVDRRSAAVLARPATDMNMPNSDEQVAVRRGHINLR